MDKFKRGDMKVMLPVKDNSIQKNELADGFYNIQFVCIYDSVSKLSEWISAKEISEITGELSSGLIEKEVHSIISKNITPMVLAMFKRDGIHVFKAQSDDVSKNIGLFQNNQLKAFSAEEARMVQNCNSSSCSSCGSACNN